VSVDRARAAAVKAHALVLNGRSVDDALADTTVDLSEPQRARSRAITYESCRWHLRWVAALELLLSKKLKAKDQLAASIIVCALVEMESMGTPTHAAVDSYVNLSKPLGLMHLRGLINGVLRRFLREREAILAKIDKQPAAQFAHPPWLLGALREDWGGERAEILEQNNGRGPMTLRVNEHKQSREDYATLLNEVDIAAAVGPGTSDIVLAAPVGVDTLPGFAAGAASVQDSAAQFSAALLAPQAGQRVLDACSAPGGKTSHLMEWARGDIEMLALDVSASRLERVQQNLDRLGYTAKLKSADAGDTDSWWDGKPFDRILLDAPCTGTGVIRRHPDIKLLRRKDDLAQLVAVQAHLLDVLWPMLAPGGVFLYATCSILRDENDRQIEAFLARTPAAKLSPQALPIGRELPFGHQLFPGDAQADGFFYARLEHR